MVKNVSTSRYVRWAWCNLLLTNSYLTFHIIPRICEIYYIISTYSRIFSFLSYRIYRVRNIVIQCPNLKIIHSAVNRYAIITAWFQLGNLTSISRTYEITCTSRIFHLNTRNCDFMAGYSKLVPCIDGKPCSLASPPLDVIFHHGA
jgi:hypothetical protein